MQTFLLESMKVMVMLSLIPMLAITASSAFVSLVQAITQIQDPSMIHLARLITISGILVIGGEWASREILQLLMRALHGIDGLGYYP